MKSLIFISVVCLLFPGLIRADVVPEIIINEVAWMGTLTSANDEWIELYNQTGAAISVEGWILKATDGSPKINLAGVIPSQSFWLLERTDDSSVVNINADQIYTGALNNSGETLKLYNNEGELVDSATGGGGWPAGDNATKRTMERKNGQLWQASQDAGGTPKTKNSAPKEEIIPQIASSPTAPTQSKTTNLQEKPGKDNLTGDLAAAVGGQTPQRRDVSVIILLTALALAVFSGATILILKKGLK